LPRRLGALLYDSLLLGGLLLMATVALLPLTGGRAIAAGTPWFSLYVFAIVALFFGWFWTHGGQTLGMRAWKLRLRRHDGGPVRWWQALVRLLLAGWWLLPMAFLRQMLGFNVGFSLTVGLLLFALTLLLRLHDRYSETEVVRVLPSAPEVAP
jgi:uncharacterized RDD family membrane protein YckC